MKKGKLKEDKVVKISITAKRVDEEIDEDIKVLLEKFLEKKERRMIN